MRVELRTSIADFLPDGRSRVAHAGAVVDVDDAFGDALIQNGRAVLVEPAGEPRTQAARRRDTRTGKARETR